MEILDRSWDFSKSRYRNFYDNRVKGLKNNGRWLKLVKDLRRRAPAWHHTHLEPNPADPLHPITVTDPDLMGGIDLKNWIQARFGTALPPCPDSGSFICTLANISGEMPKAEYEQLIKYKNETILPRKGGKEEYKRYQKLGSVLEKKMREDIYGQAMYKQIYKNYLAPMMQLLNNGSTEAAEEVYYQLIRWLVKNYDLKVSDELQQKPTTTR